MPERVTGPAYYFPSIEKKYGQPADYWINLIRAAGLVRNARRSRRRASPGRHAPPRSA
jgi:hypothetical protein